MRPHNLLIGLIVLLLACGLSFGAGYFMALQESTLPRAEIAADLQDPVVMPAQPAQTQPKAEPELVEPETKPVAQNAPEPETAEAATEPALKPVPEDNVDPMARRELEAFELALDQGEKVDLSAVISGIVTDSHGTGVAGATIRGTFNETIQAGSSSTIRLAFAGTGNQGEQLATTDASGYYRIDLSRKVREKASLMVSLIAGAEGHADSNSRSVSVSNGQTYDNINLQLRLSGSVTGRVIDQHGNGVQGARVSLGGTPGRLTFEIGGMSGGGQSAVTDAGGQYTIESVPEGSHSLSLSAQGYRQVSGPTRVDVTAGGATNAPADFVVEAVASVTAEFQGSDGEAVRGWATLAFKDHTGNVAKRLSGMIGPDGKFTANEPPVGHFTVDISVRGYQQASAPASVFENQGCNLGLITLTRQTEG